MNLKEVKTLIVGTIKQSFTNKKTLDKFDGTSGTLKYNGVPVNNVPVFVADDSPVGNIISFMGNTAPKDYLICDGSEYNIADYPLLAQHILNEFGSYNYFGGDGTTAFAVPDLRNRFLKGAEDAGVNQEAGLPNITGAITGIQTIGNKITTGALGIEYAGSAAYNGNTDGSYTISIDASKSNDIYGNSETVTPTNTSVLYCIKYQITQNNISKDMVNYSLEEQVIGSWVDGKPLYQKTIKAITPTVNEDGTTIQKEIKTGIESLDKITNISGIIHALTWIIPIPWITVTGHFIKVLFNVEKQHLMIQSSVSSYSDELIYITIQYTKTTDAENSFTPDMLSSVKINSIASDEDVNDVIGGI